MSLASQISALATRVAAEIKALRGEMADAGGSGVLSGLGPPDNAIGAEGDFYFDDTDDVLYGPRVAGDGLGAPIWGQDASNAPSATTVGDYRLGATYKVLVDGEIVAARFYRDATAAVQARTLSLYENGVLVATSDPTVETATTGWVTATFPNPVTVVPGRDYTVAYRTPSSGPYVSHTVAPTMTDPARITWVAGRYDVGTAGFPGQVAQASNFFLDLQFAPSTSLWPVALSGEGGATVQPNEPSDTDEGHLWWDTDEPDVTDIVAKTRRVDTGVGLTGGGDLSADRILAIDFAPSGTSSSTKAVRADDSRLSGAPASHTHSATDINSGTLALARMPAGITVRVVYTGAAPARPTAVAGAPYVDWVGPNSPGSLALAGDSWTPTNP